MREPSAKQRERIRELNDRFRTTMTGGRVALTQGVDSLPSDVRAMAIRTTVTFDAFDADNDPHHEHDFGSFDLSGQTFFWKIDLYENRLVKFVRASPRDFSCCRGNR